MPHSSPAPVAEPASNASNTSSGATSAKESEVERRSAPSGEVVYQVILHEGENELARSSAALFWSGLAAGLSMGFSMIAEGLIRAAMPDVSWRPLVTSFGYSLGFLLVILGRQQLFTENTLTPILPLLKQKNARTLMNVLRLWGIVLGANLLGGLAIAWFAARTSTFDPQVQTAFVEIGREALHHGWTDTLLRGVVAGWLIALMVWLLPFAETARVWVIVFLTYIVALGGFSHSIAGSVEIFTLAASGGTSWLEAVVGFVIPALIGNILGGVTFVAALNHAQVTADD